MLDILSYPDYTLGPPWLHLERNFENGASRTARKRYFDIDLCTYSILQESIVTDLLRRIYKNSVRHSSVSIVYCGPAMAGTVEKFSKLKACRRLESAISSLVIANTVKASFHSKFFQLMYKHYAVFNSPKFT